MVPDKLDPVASRTVVFSDSNFQPVRNRRVLRRRPWILSGMTQKRILRAAARRATRDRDTMMREAFRLYAADIDDPDVVNVLSALATENPDMTALQLFGLANRAIDELVEASGSERAEVVARLLR